MKATIAIALLVWSLPVVSYARPHQASHGDKPPQTTAPGAGYSVTTRLRVFPYRDRDLHVRLNGITEVRINLYGVFGTTRAAHQTIDLQGKAATRFVKGFHVAAVEALNAEGNGPNVSIEFYRGSSCAERFGCWVRAAPHFKTMPNVRIVPHIEMYDQNRLEAPAMVLSPRTSDHIMRIVTKARLSDLAR